MKLNEKQFLLTGCRSGIGKSIVEMLLQEGVRVVGTSRELIDHQYGDQFSVFKTDLKNIADIEKQFKSLFANSSAFDGLICAAGFGRFGALEQFSVKQMQEVMNVNFMSQAIIVRLILPLLKKKGGGDIVLIGSEAALNGAKNGAMYCASKFALRGFAQSLREECTKSNVRICIINPGMVKTPFFESLDFQPGDDESNYIEPQDIALAVKLALETRDGSVIDEINLSPQKKVIQFR